MSVDQPVDWTWLDRYGRVRRLCLAQGGFSQEETMVCHEAAKKSGSRWRVDVAAMEAFRLLDDLIVVVQTTKRESGALAAIKEFVAAQEVVEALPDEAYLDPAKMDALTKALRRKSDAYGGLVKLTQIEDQELPA